MGIWSVLHKFPFNPKASARLSRSYRFNMFIIVFSLLFEMNHQYLQILGLTGV